MFVDAHDTSIGKLVTLALVSKLPRPSCSGMVPPRSCKLSDGNVDHVSDGNDGGGPATWQSYGTPRESREAFLRTAFCAKPETMDLGKADVLTALFGGPARLPPDSPPSPALLSRSMALLASGRSPNTGCGCINGEGAEMFTGRIDAVVDSFFFLIFDTNLVTPPAPHCMLVSLLTNGGGVWFS